MKMFAALFLILFAAPVTAEHCGKYLDLEPPDTDGYEWCVSTHYQVEEEYLQEQAERFLAPASAQTGIYCQGEGCPTRYLIEGFEVWMSPSLQDNPAYSHQYLSRYLDTVQAQLLYMGSVGVIPNRAMNALRDSGLTFYFDDPDNLQEWWPCGPMPSSGGGCYSPSTNQIGGSFWGTGGNVMNGWHWQSFILHEVAHAYHWEVVLGRFDNLCILDAYQHNRHRYYRVENSARASGIPPHEGVQIVQHWAYRTAMEYFAELSEAYFFRGTSYPWNRLELYRHDPDGYHVVREAWNDPAFCEYGPQSQSPRPTHRMAPLR